MKTKHLSLLPSRARTQNVYGVTIGGTLGHAICTSIAVIGGRLLAQRISVRTGMGDCEACLSIGV